MGQLGELQLWGGTGTGGAVRVVLELAGVRNCFGKQLGCVNQLNNARATVEGLRALRTFKQARTVPHFWPSSGEAHCAVVLS